MAIENVAIPIIRYNKIFSLDLSLRKTFESHKYTKDGINPITQ